MSGQSFIVSTMATVIAPPRERAFNRPAPGNHVEALPLCGGRGLHVDCVRLLQAAPPRFQPLGRIGPINPSVPQPRDTRGNLRAQPLDQSPAILGIRRRHHHGHEPPQGVDQEMPLAPLDLVVAVNPALFVLSRGLDAL
jgi:hypothetical protein